MRISQDEYLLLYSKKMTKINFLNVVFSFQLQFFKNVKIFFMQINFC